MKFLQLYRSASCVAALTALLLSGNASATMITIGGFANNGILTITFAGTELGGNPGKLEYPTPDAISAFSAALVNDNRTISWGLSDLGSLVYNTSTGILEVLNAFQIGALRPFALNVGSSVLDPRNYVEIYNTNDVRIARSREFPRPTAVPTPGTLLLLSAGLWLLGRRRA